MHPIGGTVGRLSDEIAQTKIWPHVGKLPLKDWAFEVASLEAENVKLRTWPRWNSVNEILPAGKGYVLFCGPTYFYAPTDSYLRLGTADELRMLIKFGFPYISHWMFVPGPPAGIINKRTAFRMAFGQLNAST